MKLRVLSLSMAARSQGLSGSGSLILPSLQETVNHLQGRLL